MISRTYRWTHWFRVGDKICCPSGHPFGTRDVWSDEGLRCDHKNSDGRDDCGRMIYLAPILRFRGEHWFWGCEIDASDMRQLERLKTPEEILEHLDLLEPRRVA